MQVRQFGGPEVILTEDVERPSSPGAGQVLIKVLAAGVNFADVQMRIGQYPIPGLPHVLGIEASGVVEAVGEGVDGFAPGDRVFGRLTRAQAEYALAGTDALWHLPDGLDPIAAAGAPITYITAWQALVTTGGLRPGERVLVQSASGGVSSAAIQVAVALGTTVVATTSSEEKAARAREIGAHEVVLYGGDAVTAAKQAQQAAGGPFHLVLEGTGTPTWPVSVAAIGNHGRIMLYGGSGGAMLNTNLWHLIRNNVQVQALSISTHPDVPRLYQEFREQTVPLFASGALRPVVDRVLPLEEARTAHELIASRSHFGKIVLRP